MNLNSLDFWSWLGMVLDPAPAVLGRLILRKTAPASVAKIIEPSASTPTSRAAVRSDLRAQARYGADRAALICFGFVVEVLLDALGSSR